tara:strand:- start:546 stop:761 length:216 start_codon:yes stop_codon:yes gene_type:complete
MSSNKNKDPNPNSGCGDYKINFSKSDLINIYVKEWVFKWCKKYHPEAFVEAEKFVKDSLDCSKKNKGLTNK